MIISLYGSLNSPLVRFACQEAHDRGWVLGVKHLSIHLGIVDDHGMQGTWENEDDENAHGSWAQLSQQKVRLSSVLD